MTAPGPNEHMGRMAADRDRPEGIPTGAAAFERNGRTCREVTTGRACPKGDHLRVYRTMLSRAGALLGRGSSRWISYSTPGPKG